MTKQMEIPQLQIMEGVVVSKILSGEINLWSTVGDDRDHTHNISVDASGQNHTLALSLNTNPMQEPISIVPSSFYCNMFVSLGQ